MTENRHIIGKKIIDLQYNGWVDEFELQRNVDRLKEKINAGIEILLGEYGTRHEVLVIDKLEIDVFETQSAGWEQNVTDKIIRSLTQALQKSAERVTQSAEYIPTRLHKLQGLVFYLENGHLPWNIAIDRNTIPGILSELLSSSRLETREQQLLIAVLQKHPAASRFTNLLTEDEFWHFILLFTNNNVNVGMWEKDIVALQQILLVENMQVAELRFYRSVLLRVLAITGGIDKVEEHFIKELARHDNVTTSKNLNQQLKLFGNKELIKYLVEEIVNPGKQKVIEKEITTDTIADLLQEILPQEAYSISPKVLKSRNEIYINNAGMVIVAPYLPALFKHLGLQEGKELKEPVRAISLMNYIVTGEEKLYEHETPLFKILSGFEIESHRDFNYKITKEERVQVESLLGAVIKNWSILKNTSVEGLRNTFLQREGKLEVDNDKYKLVVKRESYDVLLQHLPWSISMIKLPWMHQLLTVEWL